ncbi:MAG: antitoxin [Clostridia bacterium]|nr:antitoxin [Clostridia bacterium]
MVKMSLHDLKAELTEEERLELESAEKKVHVHDDDSPLMTEEQLMQFKRINRENRTKPTISLRISPATLKKAKQYGKGYTGLLSRLLDAAIDDEELVRKCI